MAKYKKVLVRKIDEEKKKDRKQERLRKESGIRNEGYFLRERTWKSYALGLLCHVGYILYAALAFIGIVMVLNPESRFLIMKILHLC